MHPLSAGALLDAWEAGRGRSWPERALTLLAASAPEVPVGEWSALTLGERDHRLLLLRERAFGPAAQALVTCTACGERLEFDLDLAGIRSSVEGPRPTPLRVAIEGFDVEFRLPTTADVVAAAESDEGDAPGRLLRRCVLDVIAQGAAAHDISLPAAVQHAVAERMREADPLADICLDLRCPHCGRGWQATFEVLGFFWTELEAWAVRLMRDVHTLASAYGWREADVLAMSAWRRAVYLELVDGCRTT